jgi:hypothetical protein
MDLTNFRPCPSDAQMIVTLFCLAWPFLALGAISNRGRSSAPFVATLVALAGIASGVWLDLSNLVVGMAITNSGRQPVITGARYVFEMAWIALWPIGWIALFALLRRHRPIVDRTLAVLAGLWCVIALAAPGYPYIVAPSVAFLIGARVVAVIALAIAIAAGVRLLFISYGGRKPAERSLHREVEQFRSSQ